MLSKHRGPGQGPKCLPELILLTWMVASERPLTRALISADKGCTGGHATLFLYRVLLPIIYPTQEGYFLGENQ